MHSSLKGITFKQNAVQKNDLQTPAMTIDVWARVPMLPLPMLIQPSVNVHLAANCKVLTVARNISILTAGTLEPGVNTLSLQTGRCSFWCDKRPFGESGNCDSLLNSENTLSSVICSSHLKLTWTALLYREIEPLCVSGWCLIPCASEGHTSWCILNSK